MSSIKEIDKTTVHRICSGQVVLNLAVAVKELVENSLDAHATSIDVRLKEYGSELVEVSDNGYGVHPSNFEGLTLKHHTSKLKDFSDLISVETFGFRGEALSSLCALSELSILTRHESETLGTALVYDKNGHISEKNQQSRQVGSTVSLANLFSTLPVRQKEFHKNLKREFNKMVQLLYAYCLVSTGVKITCVNQTKKGARTTFMATQGCKSVKENISCIFGSKQLTTLLEMKQKNPPDEVLSELKVTLDDCSIIKLDGYISSCSHGSGRGTNDRQFYYINSRPCEPSKITKIVNEIYHQFNVNQYPFVFLNISVKKSSVDVNVTPDKRQVFLIQEKLILEIIKHTLLDLYEKIPSTFTLNGISSKFIAKNGVREVSVKPNLSQFDSWRHKNDGKRTHDLSSNDHIPKKQIKLDGQAQRTLDAFNIKKCSANSIVKLDSINITKQEVIPNVENMEDDNCVTKENSIKYDDNIKITESGDCSTKEIILENDKCLITNDYDTLNKCDQSFAIKHSADCTVENSSVNDVEELSISQEKNLVSESEADIRIVENENEYNSDETVNNSVQGNNISVVYDEFEERNVRSITLPIGMSSIKEALQKRIIKEKEDRSNETFVKFRATIDPSKNVQAEKELSKEISKDMFNKMDIIGQFNLGFIITKLGSDLFIIDQHATDEKYNFETLQKTTIISNQKLVNPQLLELTAANECILMDNIEVFKKNGFEFKIDEDALPTKRVNLTAIPMSRSWIFGKDDIDELIFMLEDSPGANCRPSRVRAMFASRACRKSVMIGTALSKREMRRLVDNMGTIEQPWNCPHGRPTMRHLINLDLISNNLS